MEVLVAIITCESFRTNGNNDAVRNTWLPDLVKLGVDYKFFMGQGSKSTKDDEVLLDAPDDYHNVTYKTKEMYKYAAAKGYEYVFLCYPDTYVCPSRLMNSGFEQYDYVGNFVCNPSTGPYACGGTGHWASADLYMRMLDAAIPIEDVIIGKRPLRARFSRAPKRPESSTKPYTIKAIDMWAEDKWIGDMFNRLACLKKRHDPRYEDRTHTPGPEATNCKITQHLSEPGGEGFPGTYDPQWMYDKHHRWQDSMVNVKRIKKVAVITPSLASRCFLLEECKASVLAQTWDGEIYHAIGFDENKEGPTVTRNKIVRSLDSSFEWIAFVDDDDTVDANHLAALIASSGEGDVIYSECREEGFIKTWNTRAFNYDDVKAANYIPVTVLMRRSLFDKIGGYKVSPPGEDQELWLRAALAGGRFVYLPQVTWTYRQHPEHRSPFTSSTETGSPAQGCS